MTGTTHALNLDMLFMPPNTMTTVSTEMIIAVHSLGKAKHYSKALAIVFDCTLLKANPNVRVINTAKITAHHLFPNPFWM